jgi:Type IV secretion-system coupling protein DNA-binding domain/TraM recognition site of TraD and TraG
MQTNQKKTVLATPVKPKMTLPPKRIAKIALIQLDYNPCYKFRINYMIEPGGLKYTFSNAALSTLQLSDPKMDDHIKNELRNIQGRYVNHLREKIIQILTALQDENVDLVCFPEYCVPAELISDLLPYAKYFGLVLPSHTATRASLKSLSDLFDCGDLPWHPGQSLYIAIPKNGDAYICPKVTRSKFESSLIPGTEISPLPLLDSDSPIVVAMCSDFLEGRNITGHTDRENPLLQYLDTASLRIICSFTPSTTPFFELASQDILRGLSLNRRPTAFVNHAEAGGTSVFAIMEKEQILDPATPHSSYQLPANVEGVAIYEIALGPQVEVKPSPTTVEQRSKLISLRLLKESSAIDIKENCQLSKQAYIQMAATQGVLDNITKGIESIGDLATEDMRRSFAPIDLKPDASTLAWRVDAASSMYEVLHSLRPSIDIVDRKAIDMRLDMLEGLIGRVHGASVTSSSKASLVSATAREVDTTFEEISGSRTSLVSVFRLASLSHDAPLERVVGPIWSLLSSVIRDPNLSFEIRYEIIGGREIGQLTVLNEFTIEIFVIARYQIASPDDKAAAQLVQNDIRGLLQTGFSTVYRFVPVSNALWGRYRASQQMTHRIRAGHELQVLDGKRFIIPYQGHPQISKVLRFLFSRGQSSSLSLSVYALADEEKIPYITPETDQQTLQAMSQKTEKSLDDALHDISLMNLLRTPSIPNTEEGICRLEIKLALPEQPSSIITEVVMRELLGEDFTFLIEQKDDNQWGVKHSNERSEPILSEVASLRECLMLLRFPVGSLPSFGDRTYTSTLRVPIEVVEDQEGCLLGHAFHPDAPDSIPVYISNRDRRKHLYVIGKTGTGKTQLLLSMIMQDIEKGSGVCIIDPHGDLYEDILNRFPVQRLRDLILFDPTDADNPPGLNLFEYDRQNAMQRDFVLDEAISIFLRLHGHEIFGPRIQNYFRSGTLALMSEPARERTLLDIARLFVDDEFFNYIMNAAADPAVSDFLSEFKKTATNEKAELLPYFQSKFTPFVSNSMIRHVIGQSRSTINFRNAMDQSKVVLINLSKGKLGELNSRLLGMVLVSKITWAALSRAQMPPEQRTDFFLYCDEFQSFATDSFSTILSEARKYGLCLTLAHQHLSQLRITDNYTQMSRESLRDAVLGNVGNMVLFRTGAKDAEDLSKEIIAEGIPIKELVELLSTSDRFRAVARLDCGGLPTRPFTLQSILTTTPINLERSALVREYVTKQTLFPKDFVLGDINSSRTDYNRW